MKKIKLYMTAMMLSLFSIQSAKAIGYEAVEQLIRKNDFEACHTILELLDTESEFMNGRGDVFRYWPNATIQSDTLRASFLVGTDNGGLMGYLFWYKDRFYDIDVSYQGYEGKTLENLEPFIDKMSMIFKKGEIAFVEKKFEKRLSEMNVKELCCASLTLLYWRMN